jgi:fatty-acyl-CoA synthase
MKLGANIPVGQVDKSVRELKTLTELLAARRHQDAPWLVCPTNAARDASAARASFAGIHRSASEFGVALLKSGVPPRSRVVMIADNGPEFFWAFFGALLANMVPVPVHTPFLVSDIGEYAERVKHVIEESSARLVVLGTAYERLAPLLPLAHAFAELVDIARSGMRCQRLPIEEVSPDSVAFIQYSSGSTRRPRGVELTHGAVLENVRAIGAHVGAHSAASWLPMFHDMGLGAMLHTLHYGTRFVLMRPTQFLREPASWLWAMSRFGATITAAPSFAYALCASAAKVPDDALRGLDLKVWRVALNGSEMVHCETLEAFCRRFARFGFAAEAMMPVYGLAENVLACTFPPLGRAPRVDQVDRAALEGRGLAEPASVNPRRIASVGRPLPGQEVRVVDSAERAIGERTVGHIQIRGSSVMRAYCARPDETRAAFTPDRWLRTGDLGYLADGELFIVGREKEVIKRAGAKYDAADMQSVVGEVEGVKAGGVSVFGLESAQSGREQVIVVAESQNRHPEPEVLRRAIERAVVRVYSLTPDDVVIVKRGTLPKTSSGKLRNDVCRRRYLGGILNRVGGASST